MSELMRGRRGRSSFLAAAMRAVVDRLEGRMLLSSTLTTVAVPGATADAWDGSSSHIVSGPDGNLWMTDPSDNQIVRISPAGQTTAFALPVHDTDSNAIVASPPIIIDPLPGSGSGGSGSVGSGSASPTPDDPMPTAIAVGFDNALWFTEDGVDRIGRISTDGTITEYQTPSADSNPDGIALGADKSMWFIETGTDMIGRITPAGRITEFSLDGLDVSWGSSIVKGPGQAMYVLANDTDGNSVIARITSAGAVTDFAAPDGASDLTLGPDGNLWVANYSGEIDKIVVGGAITSYPISSGDGASAITTGPDGALWFVANGVNQLGRVTTDGSITEFSLPDPANAGSSLNPASITTGSDGNLWLVDSYNPEAYSVAVSGALLAGGVSATVTAGSTSTVTLATFTDLGAAGSASDYTALVAWSDGSTSTGTIAPDLAGGFDVTVSKNWTLTSGSATVTIADTRAAGRTATALSTFYANLPQATGTAVDTSATTAVQFTGTTATFSNVVASLIADYSATIDWGDGHASGGTLTVDSDGNFDVSGSHTYAAEGSYSVTTTLSPWPGGIFEPGIGVFAGGVKPIAVKSPTVLGTGAVGNSATAVLKPVAKTTSTTANFGLPIGGLGGSTIAEPIGGPIFPILPPFYAGFASATGTMTVAPSAMDGTGYSVEATSTTTFAGDVASFTLNNPTDDLSHYHATVQWSDPSARDWDTLNIADSAGAITADGQGGFTVSTSASFPSGGLFHFIVSITDDRLSGAAATVGIAYGEVIVDSPRFWLPIVAQGAANLPAAAAKPASTVNSALSQTATTTGVSFRKAPGGMFNGTVGTLTGVTSTVAKHADLSGTIHWGDGTTSTAKFVVGAKGALRVQGRHRYTSTGDYAITVDVQQALFANGEPSPLYPLHLQVSSAAHVAPFGPVTTGGVAIAAVAGQPWTGTVASFTTIDPGVAVNRAATIFWGDGTKSTGVVAGTSSVTVTASHQYKKPGKYHVRVIVTQSAVSRPLPKGIVLPLILASIPTLATVTAA
jgi:streptogramin lyase